MDHKSLFQFPGLAAVAAFAARLSLGFLIDTNHCTLKARLSKEQIELAINQFQGKMLA
ncbi:hypothetical protein [Flaviaesturariibacter terrae]